MKTRPDFFTQRSDLSGVSCQQLSLSGEHEITALADVELGSELVRQFVDLLVKGRLRDEELFCGVGEISMSGERGKTHQCIVIHRHLSGSPLEE